MNTVDEKYEHHCKYTRRNKNQHGTRPQRRFHSPEKQSIREAMVHLFARYLEMRPLFLAAARPMKVEWKMSPYLGVLPRVFRALRDTFDVEYTNEEVKQVSRWVQVCYVL